MGEIEEHQTTSTEADVRHVKTTWRDRLTSQMRFQRQDDTHRHWHLKETAQLTAKLTKKYGFDYLILGGSKPIINELYHLFPKRLRSRVVRSISLPINASTREVLEKTLAIEQELLEKATEHTLNLSGKVELVKGEAREQLQQAQGIGAFLRA